LEHVLAPFILSIAKAQERDRSSFRRVNLVPSLGYDRVGEQELTE
jgi:hypothetical protein